MVEYLKIMHRNYLCYLMLPVMALAFIFDHAISSLMYLVGYDPHGVSYLPFVSEQYRYLKDAKNIVGLSVDPFHVFELFIWMAAITSILRIGIGISFFLRHAGDISLRQKLGISGSAASAWGLFALGGMIMIGASVMQFSSGPLLVQPLLVYSPKSFIGLETYVFFVGSLAFADSILFFSCTEVSKCAAGAAPDLVPSGKLDSRLRGNERRMLHH
jgi:hypothetical protein